MSYKTGFLFTLNISQRDVIEYALNVDLSDMAIYSLFKHIAISNASNKKTIGNVIYYQFTAAFIIEQLPILGITTRQNISRRIQNLIACGLIEAYPNNQKECVSLFTFGKTHYAIHDKNAVTCNEKVTPPVTKKLHTCNEKVTPPVTKKLHYNNTIDKINNNKDEEETPPSQSKAKKVKAVTISKMETVEAEAMPEIHSEFIWRLKHTNEPERKAKLEQHVISELKTKLPERLGRLGYHYTAEQLDAFINDQIVKKGIDAAKTQFFQNGDIGKCDTVEHIINSALYQIKNNGSLNIPETVKQKAAAKQVKHNHPFFDL